MIVKSQQKNNWVSELTTCDFHQCREVRTKVGSDKKLDYLIIPASAAIVATVIIAVIIFIACLKASQRKRGKVRNNPDSSYGTHLDIRLKTQAPKKLKLKNYHKNCKVPANFYHLIRYFRTI